MKELATRVTLPVVLLIIIIMSASSFTIFSNFKTSLRKYSEEKILNLTK